MSTVDESISVNALHLIADISRVLNTVHMYDESHRLAVSLYYESLGPVPPEMGNVPRWIPPSVTVNFDPRIVQFVAGNDAFRSGVEASLNDLSSSCTITWPDSTTPNNGMVEISFAEVSNTMSRKANPKACTDRLSELLDGIEAGRIDVLQDVWPSFVDQWDEQFPKADKSVRIQVDPDKCCIHVVGEREKCKKMMDELEKRRQDLVDDLLRSKTRVSERIQNMPQHQLSLLESCGFFKTESSDDFTASIVDNVIVLEGQPEEVMSRKMKMYEKLAGALNETARVNDYVLTALKQEPFRRHLEQLLQVITGVIWYTDGKEIEVYGEDQDKVLLLFVYWALQSQKLLDI